MKALLLFCMFILSLALSKEQNKNIYNQYYCFNSACHFTYTINEASILTLYKDSTFILEVFVSQYDYNNTHTKSSYSGQWKANNEVMILKYLNQETKSISEKLPKIIFSPNRFVLSWMPINCTSENGHLVTDSKLLPIMDDTKSKILALAEKSRFENLANAQTTNIQQGKLF